MPFWTILLRGITAQTPPPNSVQGIGETVTQTTEALNQLGSISPAVQLTAGITILLGFMLLMVVYEWRKANTESAFRDALQKQADYAQTKRLEVEKKLDTEAENRRKLQDEVATLQRKIDDCLDSESRYTKLSQEFEAYKLMVGRNGHSNKPNPLQPLEPEGD